MLHVTVVTALLHPPDCRDPFFSRTDDSQVGSCCICQAQNVPFLIRVSNLQDLVDQQMRDNKEKPVMQLVMGGKFAQQIICRSVAYRSEKEEDFYQVRRLPAIRILSACPLQMQNSRLHS